MKNVRLIRQTEPGGAPSTALCPVIWAAVRRNGGKKLQGTFVQGFDSNSRKETQRAIDDAVIDGRWKKGQLRAARIADCRIQKIRALGAPSNDATRPE